jgi:hypothetical protein
MVTQFRMKSIKTLPVDPEPPVDLDSAVSLLGKAMALVIQRLYHTGVLKSNVPDDFGYDATLTAMKEYDSHAGKLGDPSIRDNFNLLIQFASMRGELVTSIQMCRSIDLIQKKKRSGTPNGGIRRTNQRRMLQFHRVGRCWIDKMGHGWTDLVIHPTHTLAFSRDGKTLQAMKQRTNRMVSPTMRMNEFQAIQMPLFRNDCNRLFDTINSSRVTMRMRPLSINSFQKTKKLICPMIRWPLDRWNGSCGDH